VDLQQLQAMLWELQLSCLQERALQQHLLLLLLLLLLLCYC
jgi:hypothetical protein